MSRAASICQLFLWCLACLALTIAMLLLWPVFRNQQP